MPKTRNTISQNVTEQLRLFELSLNRTMHLGALLAAELPRASIDARVAPEVGNEALGHILASLQRMQEARTETVRGHEALALVRDRLGLPETATGDKYDPDVVAPNGLRAVA